RIGWAIFRSSPSRAAKPRATHARRCRTTATSAARRTSSPRSAIGPRASPTRRRSTDRRAISVRTYEELLESAHEAMRRDDLLRAIDDCCAALSLVSDLRDDPRWLESRCLLARACFVEDTPIPAACSRHGTKAIELLGLTHFAFQGNEELGRLWEGRTWIKVASFAAVNNRQAENYWQYAVEGMERGKAPRHELVH